MPEITVTTKLPLTSGKEATLKLEDGVVEIKTPASFSLPKTTLTDLRVALEELEAAAAVAPAEQLTVDQQDAGRVR